MSVTTRITPEVVMNDSFLYLIRIDGTEFGFVENEAETIRIIDSLADEEVRKRKSEDQSLKVFRENIDGGKRVKIYTQSMGYIFNGSPYRVMDIDFIPVGHALLLKDTKKITDPKGKEKVYAYSS